MTTSPESRFGGNGDLQTSTHRVAAEGVTSASLTVEPVTPGAPEGLTPAETAVRTELLKRKTVIDKDTTVPAYSPRAIDEVLAYERLEQA